MSTDRRLALLLLLLLSVAIVGCPSTTGSTRPLLQPVATGDPDDIEEHALLLLEADRRLFEPFTVSRAGQGDADLRQALATSLGRIGDPRGRADLEVLLRDPEPAVRREAVFALGLLGDEGAKRALFRSLTDSDREVGRLAVASLATLGAALVEVDVGLAALSPEEGWLRLGPHLFRYPSDDVVGFAREGLASGPEEIRPWLVFALGRRPHPDGLPLLRELLSEPGPWARSWAARGLGAVGQRSDLERLGSLLSDPESEVVVRVLLALRELFARGEAAPPVAWTDRLVALMEDERPAVRLTALEVASAWARDDVVGRHLAEVARAGAGREREVALVSLCEGSGEACGELVAEAAVDVEPRVRRAAARSAALVSAWSVLEQLTEDTTPAVRTAALSAWLDADPDVGAFLVDEALLDPDPGVRAVLLEWLGEHPVVELERLAAVLLTARTGPVAWGAVEALVARGANEPLERGATVAVLEKLASSQDYPLRLRAIEGLRTLGREAPAPGSLQTDRTVDVYRDVYRRTRALRRFELRTGRGVIRIEVDCPSAPLTCLNFYHLAQLGFYDGLEFHRVVPGFVAQAGDPRGDGWGGADYTIRDEPNRRPFDLGTVGMATAGPETGSSQFFVTLSRQPHLDGRFTAFGRVVEGLEVLARLEAGDRITSIRQLD